MAIYFEAQHTCEKCRRSFEWCYFEPVRNRFDNIIHVEEVPNNKTIAHQVHLHNGKYSIEINCPYCDYENRFVYQKN